MSERLRSRLLSLLLLGGIASFFMAVFATQIHQNPYTLVGPFAGCYSNGTDDMVLKPDGELLINRTKAGTFGVLKPVAGKHGFLVEATGLNLVGGSGASIRAAKGDGGFLWPISDKAIDLVFAPDTTVTLRRLPASSC